jgi:hypothetical protein
MLKRKVLLTTEMIEKHNFALVSKLLVNDFFCTIALRIKNRAGNINYFSLL